MGSSAALSSQPHEPGSGGISRGEDRQQQVEAILRRLELTITRRLDGLLHGNYLGLMPGPGSESGESREYRAGDDVRRMDWPVTARTSIPYVRESEADRELETWIVYDASASLDFGTALYEKRDLAIAGLAAIIFLTAGGGNRIGCLVIGGRGIERIPARSGMPAARALIRQVMNLTDSPGRRGGSLGEGVDALRRMRRRRGLAVVVSDFLGDLAWEEPLRALGTLQQVLAIEVVDPRELELPDVGLLHLVDPETGDELEVQTASREVRERYAAAARAQRAAIAAALRRARAAQLLLRTDRDWLLDIVRFAGSQRRRRLK